MSDLAFHDHLGMELAAGETGYVTYPTDGRTQFEQAVFLVKATLEAGATVTFSLEASTEAEPESGDWFTVPLCDLTAATKDNLVASKAITESCQKALFALTLPCGKLRVKVVVATQGATVDLHLMICD